MLTNFAVNFRVDGKIRTQRHILTIYHNQILFL